MIRFLRYISLRFWLVCLTALPICFWWLSVFDQWLPGIPVPVIFLIVFSSSGIFLGLVMDFLGSARIRGLIREGELWEQAGIPVRAEQKYLKAIGIFDSAWISPWGGRREGPRLRDVAARFYLAAGGSHPGFKLAAEKKMLSDPGDETLALLWLRQAGRDNQANECNPSLLTALSDAHYRNPEVVRYLVPQFLNSARTDFSARRIYRYYQAEAANALPADDILLSRINSLVGGSKDFDEMNGESRLTLADLRNGAGHSSVETDKSPGIVPPGMGRQGHHPVRAILTSIGPLARCAAGVPLKVFLSGRALGAAVPGLLRKKSVLRLMKILFFGGLGLWLLFFAWNTLSHISKPTPEPARRIEIQIQKPFTIQVAAYLKPSHADQYVATLKKNGITAKVKKTGAGGKTWYLVRVSEFADKKSAADYGNRLKSKNIIDDFFVSNK